MSDLINLCTSARKILANLLKGKQYAPTHLYIEFRTDGLSVPLTELESLLEEEDSTYYAQLRDNSLTDRDFLRVPILSATVAEDSSYILFSAMATGPLGVGKKPATGAQIYGLALVACPSVRNDEDDISRDILWARGYFDVPNQIALSGDNILVTFKLNLN